MRTPLTLVLAAVLLVPAAAFAQSSTPPAAAPPAGQAAAPARAEEPDVATSNYVDFGGRGTWFADGSDEARYQRYRDLRNGPTLDVFRWGQRTDTSWLDVQADHVGYRDQRYSASFNRLGKLKASFEWNQIPLFFSETTLSLYASPSDGVLLLPDEIQTGLQNKTITLPQAVAGAAPFDLRLKRNIADFKLTYSATPHLDFSVWLKNTTKNGSQPWAGTFGFSDAVELAAPVDTRTTDLGAATELTNTRGVIRVGYDGSFFRNNISTLVWDNPLRIADSTTAGPVQGRMSIWPDSSLNAGTVSGLVKLPARSQATGYVSLGSWSQNDLLIPFTINSTLPVFPLDRTTADAQARVTATAFTFNSRPTNAVWLNARFRSYDFDNRTPVFHVTNTVSYDTTPAAFAEGGTSPFSFTRRTFDADASFTPVPYTAFRVGYTHEGVDQAFRTFDTTSENTLRLSADATGIQWLTLRAVYEHAKRVGSGLDEQALDDIGEQTSLRHFDISDRDSDRFSGIFIVTATSDLSLNATASAGKEDRPDTEFGLRSNDNHAFSVGFDYVPTKAVSLGMSYQYEKYETLQASRQANPGPQFDDPTRDWTTDGDDRAKTFTASVDLIKLVPKTDIRAAYNVSHAESTYVYGLTPDTTLPPVQQLPTVLNELQRVTLDVRRYLTPHLAAGVVYWYEKYKVNDFALGAETLASIAQPSFLMLGYIYKPYTANTLTFRMTYLW